ncbi:MAG: anaerobic ribonucleoside-triphosphate reductase activating protein [Lachnospirales bacterium]
MEIRLAREIQQDSIVDGEGLRAVIWTQGCIHNCKGCHNVHTHSFKGGKLFDVEYIKEEILKLELQDGITFSGGDPFLQPEQLLELTTFCKKMNINIWAYTGYVFEDMVKSKIFCDILQNIDVLVDGKYEESRKSCELVFRGSDNQRIIDVQKTLNAKAIVLHNKTRNTIVFECSEYMYV